MRLISFAIYLGVGALLNALFVGPQFDFASAWTWGWLLGWPALVVVALWGATIAISIACIIVFVLLLLLWEAVNYFIADRCWRKKA